MNLLFCPDRPDIKWCIAAGDTFRENSEVFQTGFQNTVLKDIKNFAKPLAVGYMLFHGGEEIKETVSLVDDKLLLTTAKSERFLPEDNAITTRTLKIFMNIFPDILHYIFCDTAYFTKLPPAASTYAIPYELTRKGIRKYGSSGLCHDWVYGKIKSMPDSKNINKVVSIFVGDRTNVAAIKDGRPVETSAGFTPVEGIPSLNGCGDIDPSIIFQLLSTGITISDVNRILTNESGFRGLLGRKCRLEDIAANNSASGLDGVRDIYYYNVIKHIGYSISVMNGADAIVISCENAQIAGIFAGSLCERLKYPKFSVSKRLGARGGVEDVTGAGSRLKIFTAEYNLWKIMDEKIRLKGDSHDG